MPQIKGRLSTKDEGELRVLLQECTDIYSDAYITKSNLRLFIKENPDILIENLKNGDKIIFDEESAIIIIGYSDKSPRKYIKILLKNNKTIDKLLKILLWSHGNIDLYAKIKINNPIKATLEKNNFRFVGNRGKEILLIRKGIKVEIKEKSYVS